MKIKCIASDLGHVLIDFDRDSMINEFSDLLHKTPAQVVNMFLKSNLAKQYETGQISTAEFLNQINIISEGILTTEDFIRIWSGYFKLNNDYLKFLTCAKDSVKLIMVSNTNELHFDNVRNNFPEIFIFDEYFLSYEMNCMKPDTEYYNYFIERTGFSPDEVLFIDDKAENIETASKIGINTIQYIDHNDFNEKIKAYRF